MWKFLITILIVFLIYGLWPHDFIRPPDTFLNSTIMAHLGMNAFPFGEISIREFTTRLAGKQLDNGKHPEIEGWTASDNVYTYHVRSKIIQ